MRTMIRRPHATSVPVPESNRVMPWEDASSGTPTTPIYHDPTGDGYVVKCRRHSVAWWAPTSEGAAELAAAPYAFCDHCRNDIQETTTALLQARKVWVARCRAFDPDEVGQEGAVLQTYQVTGEVSQSRAEVERVARRTYRLAGVQPVAGVVLHLEPKR